MTQQELEAFNDLKAKVEELTLEIISLKGPIEELTSYLKAANRKQ